MATLNIETDDLGNTGAGGVLTDTDTIALTVDPVNDAPSFQKGADQTVDEDAGPRTVVGWATGISAGGGENGQTLSLAVGTGNDALFASGPAVDPLTGDLTYTPAPNANGEATVIREDDGGTPSEPADDATSGEQTFEIAVKPINDAPSISDLRPAEGSTTIDRPPTISATVEDPDGELLAASGIKLYLDGK